MWKAIVIVCCVGFVIPLGIAKPTSEVSPRLYENQILEMLEDLRLRMCYHDPDGLPQLEPLVLNSQFDLNFKDEATRLNAFVRNVTVVGLSRFVVDLLSLSLTLKFNVAASIPRLVISGEYGVDANLAGYLKVNGEGPFRLEFGGMGLATKGAFVYDDKLMLRDLALKPALKFLSALVNGLTANQMITEFLNEIASNAIPEIVNEHIPPQMMASFQKDLEDLASEYLKNLTVADLLKLLSGGSQLPPLDLERACKVGQRNDIDL